MILLLAACIKPPPPTGELSGQVLPLQQSLEVVPPTGVRLDPSGLARWSGDWVTVSDKVDAVFKLVPDGELLRAERLELGLPEPLGSSTAGGVQACGNADARFDLEGLAVCGDTLVLVSEEQSSLVVVGPDGARQVRLDLDAVQAQTRPEWEPMCSWGNAGLEGVACEGERIWVAKEREPRLLVEVSPQGAVRSTLSEEISAQDSPGRAGVRGEFWASYSDLFAQDGKLYALERHSHSVLRFDAESGALEQRVALAYDEHALYDYGEPYGLAEGLFLEDDSIWLLLDSGGHPLKASGEQRALMLRFERPADF